MEALSNIAALPRVPSFNQTSGNFADEKLAQKWLEDFLSAAHLGDGTPFFARVLPQQSGQQLFRKHRQEETDFRCDLLLIPSPVEIRESLGAVVVEIKKSGLPIGKPLSQINDYLLGVFPVGGVAIVPSFGFLFPCEGQHQATASWMAHQNIGGICIHRHTGDVEFHIGEEHNILLFNADGLFRKFTPPKSGRKAGSR